MPSSRSSAEGTAAEVAAPAATCAGGAASLQRSQSLCGLWVNVSGGGAPFYLESRHTGFRANIPHQLLELNDLRGTLLHLLIIVFRVLVVPDPHELLVFVRSSEDESGHTQDIFGGDLGWVDGSAFEFERINPHRYGSDEAIVEFLVKVFLSGT
jgi:hypothetical protein